MPNICPGVGEMSGLGIDGVIKGLKELPHQYRLFASSQR